MLQNPSSRIDSFSQNIFNEALSMARTPAPFYGRASALCDLALAGEGYAPLVAEAEATLETDCNSVGQYAGGLYTIADTYMQLGQARRAWATIERLPEEDVVGNRYHLFVAYCHGDLPQWPEDMLGKALDITQDVAPLWSYDFLTNLAKQHPAHAPRLLNTLVEYPYQSAEDRKGDSHASVLRGVVGVACGMRTARPDMLAFAHKVADEIPDGEYRLQADISLAQAAAAGSPKRALQKLKRRAVRQLERDPDALGNFLADLRANTKGKLVSRTEEEATALANPDPFERASCLIALAKVYKDPELVRTALQSAGNISDKQGGYSLASTAATAYGVPGSARLAKPYILRLLKDDDDPMNMRDHRLGILAETIAKDGTPAEAQGILDVMDREDQAWPRVAAAIVRATAALGKNHYAEADRFAQRNTADRRLFEATNTAGLAIGSCHYRTGRQIRTQLADVKWAPTRSEAFCEIALATGKQEYLGDAAAAAREIGVMTNPHGPVKALIHVIESRRVMLGHVTRPVGGIGWENGVHRWAFSARGSHA
jgi:hypothetical protein